MLKNKARNLLAILMTAVLIFSAHPMYASSEESESPYTIGTYEETVSSTNLSIVPLHTDVFIFEQKDARLEEKLVSNGASVKEGDPLFTYTCPISAAPHEEARLLLERTKLETEEGIAQREKDIEKLEDRTIYNVYDQQIQEIRLEQMRADLELYKLQQERLIADYQERYDELTEEYEVKTYFAEASGIVTYEDLNRKIPGTMIEKETIWIADPDSYRVVIASSGGFRYGMEVSIEYGLKGNQSTVTGKIIAGDNLLAMENVSLGELFGRNGDEKLYVVEIEGVNLLEVLENPNAFSSPLVTGLRKHEENVGILQRQYVKTENGRFYVTIEEENSRRRQYLQVAASGLDYLWIVSGLSPNDRILLR